MRVVIDDGACCGHGRCYSFAPLIFDADEYGQGIVIKSEIEESERDLVDVAISNCPEAAISLIE